MNIKPLIKYCNYQWNGDPDGTYCLMSVNRSNGRVLLKKRKSFNPTIKIWVDRHEISFIRTQYNLRIAMRKTGRKKRSSNFYRKIPE